MLQLAGGVNAVVPSLQIVLTSIPHPKAYDIIRLGGAVSEMYACRVCMYRRDDVSTRAACPQFFPRLVR
jgi:C4-type Zn-finger protein